MVWICLAAYLVFLTYAILIAMYTAGWVRMKLFNADVVPSSRLVSVIVAVRNEEKTLSHLLEAITNQTFRNYELIIIDDHSTDNTLQTICNFNLNKCHLISLPDDLTGKKAGLKYGISIARGELIVTTDADCIPGKKWLETLFLFYEKEKPEFIIAPVKHFTNNLLLQKLISVDFLALQASGAGAAEIQLPFICNGANLAFTKTLWEKTVLESQNSFASGDDTFLLHSAIKKLPPEKIRFLFSENAIVTTPPPGTIKDFFHQRVRWASKARGYKNNMSVWTSVIVFSLVCTLTFLMFGSFFSKTLFYCFLGIILLKTIIEVPLMFYAAKFYKEKGILRYFFLLPLIYFIYSFIIAVYSLFGKFVWKERLIKN